MRTLLTLADRTAVLFLGVAAGRRSAMPSHGGAGEVAGAREAVAPAIAPPPPAGRRRRPGGPRRRRPRPSARCRSSSHLLETVAEGRKVRVGVFGDSYGDGIWSALYHLLPAKDGYEVRQVQPAIDRLHPLRQPQPRGACARAACRQSGRHRGDLVRRERYAGRDAPATMPRRCSSPEWQEIVGKRVDGFVRELRAQGAIVYWVGLPKMRKPEFDADIAGDERLLRASG